MSYGIYIGKNHTADGIAYLGGYGDEPSSHWLEVVERKQHSEGTTIKVGVTAQADLPGVITKYRRRARPRDTFGSITASTRARRHR